MIYRIFRFLSLLFIICSWVFLIIYILMYNMTAIELRIYFGDNLSTKSFFLSAMIMFFLGLGGFNLSSYKIMKQEEKEKRELEIKRRIKERKGEK